MAAAEEEQEVLDENAATQKVQAMIKNLEDSYKDAEGDKFSDGDQIWMKFTVLGTGKKKDLRVVYAGTGNSISSVHDAMVDKEVSFFWVILRGNDDDGPLRTYPLLFKWQAPGLKVSEKSRYNFSTNFAKGMTGVSPSIDELLDDGDKSDNWPQTQDGDSTKWESYIKKVKRNAGSHSVHNWRFGESEFMTFE